MQFKSFTGGGQFNVGGSTFHDLGATAEEVLVFSFVFGMTRQS